MLDDELRPRYFVDDARGSALISEQKMRWRCIARSLLLLSVLASSLALGRSEEYCQNDGCPSGGELPASSDNQSERKEDTALQSLGISSAIWSTMTWMKDTIVHNVYNKTTDAYKSFQGAYDKTAEFVDNLVVAVEDITDKVRHVFREEFNSYLAYFWDSVVGTNAESDNTLFWKFRKAAKRRMLAVVLVMFCLILDYFLWKSSNNILSAIINIITLNTVVALAYEVLGPELLYWGFFQGARCALYTLAFVWSYPYASAVIVSMLCVGGNLYQWRRRVNKDNMIKSMYDRLKKVESQNKRMEEQLNKIVKQNENLMAQILKKSLSDLD